ncbi:hypothetical protein COU36_05140 [Candidatus Micrarchaeota archaeon CG10_big_fil_rev_8_21_14_0_10_59_7]|nr:MAG: hypothetical protein COU36_05140 [Candidatus Micrarchaeota archaeon CG10_big_fil_rev_8_21_14_0_10_59_7]
MKSNFSQREAAERDKIIRNVVTPIRLADGITPVLQDRLIGRIYEFSGWRVGTKITSLSALERRIRAELAKLHPKIKHGPLSKEERHALLGYIGGIDTHTWPRISKEIQFRAMNGSVMDVEKFQHITEAGRFARLTEELTALSAIKSQQAGKLWKRYRQGTLFKK